MKSGVRDFLTTRLTAKTIRQVNPGKKSLSIVLPDLVQTEAGMTGLNGRQADDMRKEKIRELG